MIGHLGTCLISFLSLENRIFSAPKFRNIKFYKGSEVKISHLCWNFVR